MIRLPLHLKQMGLEESCGHRSGWKYVLDHLKRFHDEAGVLLDDFVERTFQHPGMRNTWSEPWVGIFHHPFDFPSWLDDTAKPDSIYATTEFRASQEFLRGAIAMSDTLAQNLRRRLRVPVLNVHHPTEPTQLPFSVNKWLSNLNKRLIQVGWYGRNTRAIQQIRTPKPILRTRLLQEQPWVIEADRRISLTAPTRNRPHFDGVETIPRVCNRQYDHLLSENIVFGEYYAVSASNTIIECIERSTPILVNRKPEIVEYLGTNYPFFYDTLREAEEMLERNELIEETHLYMEARRPSLPDISSFCGMVVEFTCNQINSSPCKIVETGRAE